jgi:hypothetical protein
MLPIHYGTLIAVYLRLKGQPPSMQQCHHSSGIRDPDQSDFSSGLKTDEKGTGQVRSDRQTRALRRDDQTWSIGSHAYNCIIVPDPSTRLCGRLGAEACMAMTTYRMLADGPKLRPTIRLLGARQSFFGQLTAHMVPTSESTQNKWCVEG